jgi:hypothetical protein
MLILRIKIINSFLCQNKRCDKVRKKERNTMTPKSVTMQFTADRQKILGKQDSGIRLKYRLEE